MLHRRGLLRGLAGLGLAAGVPARLLAKVIGYPRLLQGPMVGATAPDGFTVWARAAGRYGVSVEYTTDRSFGDAKTSAPVVSGDAEDLTVRVPVAGLKPDTDYWYRIKADGIDDRYQPTPFRTRTAPAAGSARPLRIAFGSCCKSQIDAQQPIWDAVAAMEPDLFLWLGDNIYADSDASQAYTDLYARQRNIASYARFAARVPQLAIWDDHDFGYNDATGDNPVKEMTLGLFRRWWANPAGGLPDAPGVFFRHGFGPVDLFMLDGRYHRVPGQTMLGAAQLAWLKRELKASRATFKVLVSSTGWSCAKQTGDSWAGYLPERDAILDFIRDERIAGCFGISGDVHMGEANCVPWSDRGGYDFYDLVSSGLAQVLSNRFAEQTPEVRLRQPFTGGPNFGVLDFEFTPKPRVRLRVLNHFGDDAFAPVTVAAADLVNGRSSWRRAIDREQMKRREQQAKGGSYYA
jgi:alkaline phosphatase D